MRIKQTFIPLADQKILRGNPPTTVRTWQIVTENPGIEVKVIAYPSNLPAQG
jgi:hypothetical protein